jgi:lysine-specific demethylase/histidyl-hydroxylase NO66
MKPETSTQHNESGGGEGLSRAAKKRAKKKEKGTEKRPAEQEASANKVDPTDGNMVAPVLTKKIKLSERSKRVVVPAKTPSEEGKEKPDNRPTESTNPFPDTPLVEILLLKDAENKEKLECLQGLTANHRARCLFQAILDPIPLEEFYKDYWEKKPLLVKANKNKHRYDGLLSLKKIKEMSKKCPLYYARDLNVTRYHKDAHGVKRRVTLDKLPEDEKDEETGILVDHSELWANYDAGCTIRLLCPHKHQDNVHALLSTLELELACMVGANAYLTPPNAAQGFAPHYDDIEAFCMQLEGTKRWKVYEPTFKLPRASSEDFTTEEMKEMEPVMDVTLEPGDILYMPRGWIHQACTLKHSDEHSLHLTVSAMRQWAWVDMLDLIMPDALEAAASNEISSSLRQGMPRGFLDYMGAVHDNTVDEKLPESIKKANEEMYDQEHKDLRAKFQDEAKKRIMRVAKMACEMVDAACDQMGKRFMSERLPPALTPRELADTDQNEAKEDADKEILPSTLCRLARPGIARLVLEDEKAILYHCADNSRVYLGNPLSPLEFEMDDGPALEQLLTTVEPAWILVNDLIHDTIGDKVAIVQSLYDDGILAIQNGEETGDLNSAISSAE